MTRDYKKEMETELRRQEISQINRKFNKLYLENSHLVLRGKKDSDKSKKSQILGQILTDKAYSLTDRFQYECSPNDFDKIME